MFNYVPVNSRMPEKLSDLTICSQCGQIGSKELLKCSQCHSIAYCGQECQREDWGRHKDNCIPVMITELRGKGRGLVASRDINIGQVILNEKWAVLVYDDDKNSFGFQQFSENSPETGCRTLKWRR